MAPRIQFEIMKLDLGVENIFFKKSIRVDKYRLRIINGGTNGNRYIQNILFQLTLITNIIS